MGASVSHVEGPVVAAFCRRRAAVSGGLQQTVPLLSGLTDDGLLTYIGKYVLRQLCYFLIGVGDIPEQTRALRDNHVPQFLKSSHLIWSVEVNAAPDKLKEFSR